MRLRVAGLTDVGRCRERNQDQLFIASDAGVFAVADGMGGHAAGEVASRLAVEALEATTKSRQLGVETADAAGAELGLRAAVDEGNRRILESVLQNAEWRGMGTTIVVLKVVGEHAVIGHVGDSRAYRLQGNEMQRLTNDHSWVSEQVRHGLISDEQAHRHPMRNIVTRALGNVARVDLEVTRHSIRPGDVLLLCSDGLNSMLVDDEIAQILRGHSGDPESACQALVTAANARGGEDNITVVVIMISPPTS